jgi:hypothetical protein
LSGTVHANGSKVEQALLSNVDSCDTQIQVAVDKMKSSSSNPSKSYEETVASTNNGDVSNEAVKTVSAEGEAPDRSQGAAFPDRKIKEKEKDRAKSREKGKERDRDHEKMRDRDRSKVRDCDYERERERAKDRDHRKDRSSGIIQFSFLFIFPFSQHSVCFFTVE